MEFIPAEWKSIGILQKKSIRESSFLDSNNSTILLAEVTEIVKITNIIENII